MQSAPMIHAKIAAGPAAIRPSWAPKSHPDPMIEPIEAHISPIRPISRFSAVLRRAGGRSCTDVAMTTSHEKG